VGGILFSGNDAVLVEGSPVNCPVCEGIGRLITAQGEELLEFCRIYLQPMITETVKKALEEKL
jgi:hypothetical protein